MNFIGERARLLSESDIAEDLVKRIIAGSADAEEQMVTRYQKGLEVALFQKTKDKMIVEDVIQDTWIVVLNKVRNEELRDPKRLAAFIAQTGRNLMIMWFRKSNNRREDELDVATRVIETRELSPEQTAQNLDLSKVIQKVFSEMSSRDREIIQKYFLSNVSRDALCNEYGLTSDHLSRVLYRARNRFKALWDMKDPYIER